MVNMNKIINFHFVNDVSWFENVVIILKNRYNMVTINDIEDYFYKGKKLKNSCHITIDDGYKNFYDKMYPILKKYSIPASFFVSPSICEEGKNFWFQEIAEYDKQEMYTIIEEYTKIEYSILKKHSIFAVLKSLEIDQIWEIIQIYQKRFYVKSMSPQNVDSNQLKEIDTDGLVVIGAHTQNHPILKNESEDRSSKEIIDSFRGLERILGHKIHYFAYPNGIPKFDFGEREIEILKSINCKIAFSCETKNFSMQDNPLSIPRFSFSYGNSSFVKSKLFFGEYWDRIKNIIKSGDIEARNEMKSFRNSFTLTK
jgi:peptidoglycan/xylan/chitin deacetylase (PgdA/CDA1 family)